MAEGAMSGFLTNIGTFFTQAIDWLGEVLATVSASPELTIMVLAMPIVGFAVGLLGRLIRL
ncbi:MAG: hypothetical protein E7433_01210 [Ruminococcaceae bacterium]|nr:hypothetical protein [Oscillospiraceae bacterium]